jgi:hypothetical protein
MHQNQNSKTKTTLDCQSGASTWNKQSRNSKKSHTAPPPNHCRSWSPHCTAITGWRRHQDETPLSYLTPSLPTKSNTDVARFEARLIAADCRKAM